MFAGDQGFVAQGGVEVEFLAPFGFDVLRQVTEDQDDFVGDVQAGIGIVTFASLACDGQSIAGKDHFAFELAI